MSRRYRPYITTRTPQPSGSPYTSPPQFRPRTPFLSTIDADTMARQTITYMNVLAEHAAAIRALPPSEGAYQRIVDEGRVLPPETKWRSLDHQGQEHLRRRMEALVHHSATTVEDHLEILCAAHTLLFLQHDILSCLPYPESRRIEKKINELRAERGRQFVRQEGRFHGLVPPPPLPPVERLDSKSKCCNVTPDLLNSLLDFPSVAAIIGQRFYFLDSSSDMDLLYQVRSVEIFSDGHCFAVQCEGTRDTVILDQDELKSLLECSLVVSTELNPKPSSTSSE
ncbi:hypothetical protein JVT61DRAFT_11763 [Boletus reticuloceps]|uniref:Uncharacterized protein n=1 Tax=Boletus reticuloceps TaxID=495285 RepID=A0A8I3ADD4_9AGAM|nr:hypothetical protein JVT61DRAFT_11763 [Boletus reticuloceps]